MRKKTNEQFLKEMAMNHPTLIPLEEYKNGRTKIKIHCNVCNKDSSLLPSSLYMGHGCPTCRGTPRKTHDEFVEEMKNVNNNIEIIGVYKNSKTKLKVRCSVCGYEWESAPNTLLAHKGCVKCSGLKRKTQAEFIERMNIVHPEITVMGEYKNNTTKVKCLCKHCNGYFYGIPHAMLDAGNGCPICSSSRGERRIRNWLDDNRIEYIAEHKFSDCKDKSLLPFDFYLKDLNVVIEYDGKQHYEPNEYFGGKLGFEAIKRHDEIKNQYCKDNHVALIRIPYWDFHNIDKILSLELNK